MPRTITFNSRQVIEPGAYSRVVGGVSAGAGDGDTGTVLLIDTGRGAGYGGGSGTDGTEKGLSSVYEFLDYDSFRRWNGGGEVNQLVARIFNPSPVHGGARRLLYAQTKTSAPATVTLTLDGGTVVLTSAAESTNANGVIEASRLISGLAARIVPGVVDDSKYKLQVLRGAYEGVDAAGDLIGVGKEAAATVVVESREVGTFAELSAWVARNPTGNGYLASVDVSGEGAITATDASSNAALRVFAGATEDYTATAFDTFSRAIDELDYDFVLLTESGPTAATGTANTKIFNAITTAALDTKFLIVAAGSGSADLSGLSDSSFSVAREYDSEQVSVYHGGIQEARRGGGFKTFDSLHGAATFVGLIAGFEPQVPATFKVVGVDRPTYELSKRERDAALKAGVVHLRNVPGKGWAINQDVNSKQDNDDLVQEDGTSPEGSVARIKAVLNRRIRTAVELQFVGRPLNEATPEAVATFVEKILIENTAAGNTPGLIVRAREVAATFDNGDLFVTYKFTPNGPVNRVFITGTILNIQL